MIRKTYSPYHRNVAIQRKSRGRAAGNDRKKPAGKSLAYLFWFVFFVVILLLFVINWKTIRDTVNNTGLVDRVTRRNTEAPPELPAGVVPAPEENEAPPAAVVPPKPADNTAPASPQNTKPALPAETAKPPEETPLPPPEAPKPPEVPASRPAAAAPPANTPQTAPVPRTVERVIYLIKFDEENGVILRTRVSRTLPVTDSPLLDALNALLRGPTAAEENQKLRSLIPPGTRVLSATVRGSTAYISFSEDFQFNTDGIEGYIAQLQQLVWTATEFPNVGDVQFLIEGRRVDYLGEGIRIGSPLGRGTWGAFQD